LAAKTGSFVEATSHRQIKATTRQRGGIKFVILCITDKKAL
jgi:hypothetical protein